MFRRILSLLSALALLLLCASAALAAGDMQQGSMYVNTANGKALRFRSTKSTSADNILAEIPYGTKVYVVNWDGTWARVQYNSATGYVVQKYLSIARPDPFDVVQARRAQEEVVKQLEKELKAANKKLDHSRLMAVTPPYDVTVRTGVTDLAANVYQKADLTSDIIATYEEGVRLQITSLNKDWAMIYNGSTDRTGYMLLEDLEEDVVEYEFLEDDG